MCVCGCGCVAASQYVILLLAVECCSISVLLGVVGGNCGSLIHSLKYSAPLEVGN